ncbi:glutamate--cysteine ligase [Gammaproteobacteria bacterium]|nr:glutamate--cysteine ligase [Gammaproteobacteria bacterium]
MLIWNQALSDHLKLHLSQFEQAARKGSLNKIGHGIEKESLRVDPDGHIAQSPHPAGLGSALTHPSITTDFSEALVEFITPVYHSPEESLEFLTDQHSFLFSQLDREELLWTSSMPCILEDDEKIPLAKYGSSNIGKLKTLYREGLGHRYGRAMQTIAGIHYNFSVPDSFWTLYQKQLKSPLSLKDFKTEQYFSLIRNFRRYSWLLIYLFGASPALCKSFLRNNKDHGLEPYDEATFYAPFATSLRMGDLGYTSEAQSSLYICYNSIAQYAEGLTNAIKTPYPPYEKFSTTTSQHAQLNTNVLQIENEFYSTIRPKRVTPSGKRPIQVLVEEGVEYIEVRCLDLNPFLSVGIDAEQISFLNSFLLFCLFSPSPASNEEEYQEIERNLKAVVLKGRDPELLLTQAGEKINLRDWATCILSEVQIVATLMDELADDSCHSSATASQLDKIKNSDLTPSAQVLQRMKELKTPYFTFAMNQSLANSDFFRARTLSDEQMTTFRNIALKSNQEREKIEANDKIDFDTFLKQSNDA